MAGRVRRLGAAGALVVVTSLLLLPLVRDRGPRPRACRCPVPMACCEDGSCHMDEAPSDGPTWKSCSGDGAGDGAAPPPSLEAPLPSAASPFSREVHRARTPTPPASLTTTLAEPPTPPPEPEASIRRSS